MTLKYIYHTWFEFAVGYKAKVDVATAWNGARTIRNAVHSWNGIGSAGGMRPGNDPHVQ